MELDAAIGFAPAKSQLGIARLHLHQVGGIVTKCLFDAGFQPRAQSLHDDQDENTEGDAQARETRAQRVAEHGMKNLEPRIPVHHLLRIGSFDAAVLQSDNAVALVGNFIFMGDHHNGDSLAVDFL